MSPPKPPSRSRAEVRREEVRKAAYKCFQHAGYHETTVDDICAAAGISKGSFYWNYASKQEVFIDILDTWTREVMDELFEKFEDSVRGPDYVEQISAALVNELRRARKIVPLWLEFTVRARQEEELRASLSKFYRRARTAIAEILRPAVSHRLSEEQLNAVANVVFGAWAGLVMQDLSEPAGVDTEAVVRRVVGLVGDLVGAQGPEAAV